MPPTDTFSSPDPLPGGTPATQPSRGSVRTMAAFGCFALAVLFGPALMWVALAPRYVPTDALPLKPSSIPPMRVEGVILAFPPATIRERTQYDSHGFPLSKLETTDLKRMLRRGETAELEAVLAGFQAEAERDFRMETRAITAFGALRLKDPHLRGVFDAWVSESPESAVARVARARYFKKQGSTARGTGWAKDVTDDQWKRMHEFFDLAYADAQAGLKLNPKIVTAYSELMTLANVGGARYGEPRDHFEAGLAISPNSYAVRKTYMWTLLPRWGGSYEAMWMVAEDAQAVVELDPRMRTLFGEIAFDQARLEKKDQARKVELLTTALSYGERANFYYRRARAYHKLGRWEEALADYARVIELDPLAKRSPGYLATVRRKLDKVKAARTPPEAALAGS